MFWNRPCFTKDLLSSLVGQSARSIATISMVALLLTTTYTHLTDRLSSMSHFLFPIKGSGYSSLRPFSANKWNCYDELCSKELQKWILLCTYWWKTVAQWHGMKWRKNCRYVELIRLHIIPYPSLLHGASLATAMQRLCRPLLLLMS